MAASHYLVLLLNPVYLMRMRMIPSSNYHSATVKIIAALQKHFSSRYSSPPKWLRNFFSGFMGRVLCLGNYYHQVSETHQRLELDDIQESPESEQTERGKAVLPWLRLRLTGDFHFRSDGARSGRSWHYEGKTWSCLSLTSL